MSEPPASTIQDLKAGVRRAIDARTEDVKALACQIAGEPEVGFKEVRTGQAIAKRLAELGLGVRSELALTGVKAVLDGGAGAGPTVGLLGELDALVVWEHPRHHPQTGAVHACCHHAQVAAMYGAAIGLVDSGAMSSLSGRVALMAVPAEEFIEIEDRLRMRTEGRLELMTGKSELLRLGEFDDVDMAMMVHATANPAEGPFGVQGTTNGMVAKFIRYVGRATHASSPAEAINALYAAHVAIAGINAVRETFRDEDRIRVHPIITRGGDVVSAIPADVRMETFVRGATAAAVESADRKVDRALKAGALALGASVHLTTIAGYQPLEQDQTLIGLFRANAEELVGREHVKTVGHRTGGTDMGDLGQVMPVLHPFTTGAAGTMHGADFELVDEEIAILNPARAMAMTVVDLLANGAAGAHRVLNEAPARLTKAEYLARVRALNRSEVFDGSTR